MEDAGFLAEHLTEIKPRLDHADFIADPAGNDRSFRIIQDDAFLAVEPTGALVDLREDRAQTKGGDQVPQQAGFGVEDFALPGEMIDEARDRGCEHGPGADDCGSLALSV